MSGSEIHAPLVLQFVRAVRRRIALIRIAESVAIAVAVAAGAGLMLTPILWQRGQAGVGTDLTILGIGAFCGLIWGISRRPSVLNAAAEADKQLGLHDLLGTVLRMLGKTNDHTTPQWKQTVAAMAEASCGQLRPSAIVAARLNLRAWGGVGISTALLLTLGMLSSQPVELRAADSSKENYTNFSASQSIADLPSNGVAPDQHPAEIGRPAGSSLAQDDMARDFIEDHPTKYTSDNAGLPSSNGSSSNRALPQNGSGLGMSHGNPNFPPDKLSSVSSGIPDQLGSGKFTGGNGVANTHGSAGSTTGNGVVTPANSHKPAPPWQSANWAKDSDAAQSAIDDGRVPDSDTDLVRDYFQRD